MSEASRLFFGVGVGVYDHPEAFAPLQAAEEVAEVGQVLKGYGYAVTPSPPHPSLDDVNRLLDDLDVAALPPGSCLVVLWAGHGEVSPEGGLHLVSRDSRPGQRQRITSSLLVEAAVRSGASQILVLLDTCFAEAGAIETIALARRLEETLPSDGSRRWIGLLPAAQAYERARDGLFGGQLLRLLREGPADPELRLRWSAHNAGIRGDDVIDALVKEWPEPDQSLVPVTRGDPDVMLPNPRFNPDAREALVEQLLLAAQGGNPEEEGDWFTGRVEPLAELVGWIGGSGGDGGAGVALVTGPPGCGKSALLGRIAGLSDRRDRQRILARGALEHADPGENSVAAVVAARGATLDELVRRLEAELIRSRRLRAEPEGPRNRLELLGGIERLGQRGTPPLLLIDGLEEVGGEVERIVEELLRPLAARARLVISSRPIAPRQAEAPPPLDTLQATAVVDLGALEASTQTEGDLVAYVAKRLQGVSAAMDPEAVAGEILRLVRRQEEGGFLLARLITARLRRQPLETAGAGWQCQLASSVGEALDQELADLPVRIRGVERLPQAARELLTALAWAYGKGFPVEAWAVAATALSPTGTSFSRDDVFWLLSQARRWVVESGEWGQAVYRLSHQRLAEHLRPEAWASPWKPVGEPEAVALATALGQAALAWCAAGRNPREQPYLWTYFWNHAVDAGAAGIDRLRELAKSNPSYRLDLARALHNLGVRYIELGCREEALQPTEEAAEIYREMAKNNQAFLPYLAHSLNNLGAWYSNFGRQEEALKQAEVAARIYRDLSLSNSEFLPGLAVALNNLGLRYGEFDRREDGRKLGEEAVGIFRELAESNRADLAGLAAALVNLGVSYSELGSRVEAQTLTEEAVEIFRKLAKSNQELLRSLAKSLGLLGSLWRQKDDLQAASESYREGLAVLLPALVAYPQAHRPLADQLAENYFATLQRLGKEADPELMAAYAAAFAEGEPPP